jgi:hypothetical protein
VPDLSRAELERARAWEAFQADAHTQRRAERDRLASANAKIGVGIVSLVTGLVASVASYAAAAPGSRYVVFTGLVLGGMLLIARGVEARRCAGTLSR